MTDTPEPADVPDNGALADDTGPSPDPIETLASKFGWKPKSDDFQGEWLDANAFLEMQPDKIKQAKEKAARASETAQRATRTAQTALRKAKAEMRRQLEAEMEQAAEVGDVDGVKEASRRLSEVERQPVGEVEAFKARNPWFEENAEAADYAAAVTNRLANEGATVAEQLEQAEKAVKKRFPELFESAEPEPKPAKKPPMVQTGVQSAPLAARKKGLADVPAHIRQAWTPRFCKQMQTSPEELAKIYLQENA